MKPLFKKFRTDTVLYRRGHDIKQEGVDRGKMKTMFQMKTRFHLGLYRTYWHMSAL